MTNLLRRGALVDTSFVGERAILYQRESRQAIVLNPTGTTLWQFLSEPQTREQLTQKLCERFEGLETERARADVETFITDLTAREVLESE